MTDKSDLIETIAKTDKLSTFARLMKTSGADEALRADGEFTVLAPTNDAFCKVTDKQMNALLQEPQQTTLRSILSYHILPGKFTAADLCSMSTVATITDVHVKLTDSRAGLMINDSGVHGTEIDAGNGIIHMLDTMLNYDIETFTTGPLEVPNTKEDTDRELVFPTLIIGGKNDSEDTPVSDDESGRRRYAAGRRRGFLF